jgi:peptide/nickel transport system ATP-binding protein
VARLIVGLHAPTSGRVEFRGRRMQMIFQDPYASLNPRWRVKDIVAEPIELLGTKAKIGDMLVQVGLSPDDGEKYPHEFSGGQRQRISIARALAGEPDFLVCDEPTSALDVSVQAQILNLMSELQQRLRLTYVFISHNLAVVSQIADRVGVMYLGRIVELAPTAQLFARPRHPYTRMLLDAVPDLAMSGKPRVPIAGEVPNPLAPPPGCAFHPRCPHANARCMRERPQVIDNVACHAVEEGRIDLMHRSSGASA